MLCCDTVRRPSSWLVDWASGVRQAWTRRRWMRSASAVTPCRSTCACWFATEAPGCAWAPWGRLCRDGRDLLMARSSMVVGASGRGPKFRQPAASSVAIREGRQPPRGEVEIDSGTGDHPGRNGTRLCGCCVWHPSPSHRVCLCSSHNHPRQHPDNLILDRRDDADVYRAVRGTPRRTLSLWALFSSHNACYCC